MPLADATEKRWVPRHQGRPPATAGNAPPQAAGAHPLISQILHQRGYDSPEAQDAFLNPRLDSISDPFRLPEMGAAVDRLLAAADRGERVALYGDYDVDGVTSLALLKSVLAHYGLDAHPFLPHRADEGYGLSRAGLERCIAECSPDLLVAVDCGTTSTEEVAWLAAEHSIETIVCDHHEPPAGPRPECVALVNPKLGDDFHYLCSAGVVFKLAHALMKRRRAAGLDLRELLDIVAVGTVADIVPLVGENRALVRRGLHQLAATRNAGLAALARAAGATPPFDAADVGFKLGPRLNAAGRLDTAQTALDLLLTGDGARAAELAARLDADNRERQQIESQIREQAMAMAAASFDPQRDSAIVLGSREWHAGVVGIVASRVAKKFHRPTFIVAIDESGEGKGSGRSVEGISLVAAIEQCRDHLIKGGGHEMAAGISVAEDRLETFRAALQRAVRQQATGDQLTPRLYFDAEAHLRDVGSELLRSHMQLEPLGADNPRPVFVARAVSPADQPRVLKEKHLRLAVRHSGGVSREVMYFNGNESPLPPPPWDIAFTIARNEYNGRVSVQMILEDIRSAVPAPHSHDGSAAD